jgi:uncharacterized protein DUF1801
MAENKTKETSASVAAFLKKIPDKTRRDDCQTMVDIMRDVTKEEPKMWGSSIVGFGSYHYKYASGREGDWLITGFSPRKGDLTLYLMGGFHAFPELMEKLGKHKTGKGCLYIKKLADVDLAVLKKLVTLLVKKMAPHRIHK